MIRQREEGKWDWRTRGREVGLTQARLYKRHKAILQVVEQSSSVPSPSDPVRSRHELPTTTIENPRATHSTSHAIPSLNDLTVAH